MRTHKASVAIIGAGIIGIAAGYFLSVRRRYRDVVIIDPLQPMCVTSAASGENYRNWWPHPVMTAFTDHSIDLMEEIARATDNRIHMTRRGYALATRAQDMTAAIDQLLSGYAPHGASRVRIHEKDQPGHYRTNRDWQAAPDGVDVLLDQNMIRSRFPHFDPDISAVIHVRRAGDIGSQQLGQFMMEQIRDHGGKILQARVAGIARDGRYLLEASGASGSEHIHADIVINAAGPFVGEVAGMLGEKLPVTTIAQQKIAFEDVDGAVPRTTPLAIDLDPQEIDWSDDELALLREDGSTRWLTEVMPGGVHCRPEGGERGRWIKLGWAYNRMDEPPAFPLSLHPNFPEIVLRGAGRLQPALKRYYGRLPRQMSHYGGYYTMTQENWPLIGPMGSEGAFVIGAMSGFGTMAACAAAEFCADWISGQPVSETARRLSLLRYRDAAFMASLHAMQENGVL